MDQIPKVVALDANALVCLCEHDGDRRVKLDYLVERLEKQKGTLQIPAPALSEYLVNANQAGLAIVQALERKAGIEVAAFDTVAAYECAQLNAAAQGRGDKRDGNSQAWQKIKIDRQIVAIAKARGAKLIISDDEGVKEAAARVGISVLKVDELEFPDSARQQSFPAIDLPKPKKRTTPKKKIS